MRSWSSDRNDPKELGAEQVDKLGRSRPAGNGFPHPDGRRPVRWTVVRDLQTDPVEPWQTSYQRLGLTFTEETSNSVAQWAEEPPARLCAAHTIMTWPITA